MIADFGKVNRRWFHFGWGSTGDLLMKQMSTSRGIQFAATDVVESIFSIQTNRFAITWRISSTA